ncbi:MAG: PAS domain S-box protein [Actinomycetota bacterium]|nr:PAS domain S-box protein [Actinomycetota bacterium]
MDETRRRSWLVSMLLEESDEGYGAAFEAAFGGAPVVLFALDGDGVFTLSEGRGLDALGLAPGEVVGRSALELYGDAPEIVANLRRALAGEAFASSVEVGGAVFECRYEPVRDREGTVVGVVGVAVEVTGGAGERDRVLSGLDRALQPLADPKEVMSTAARMLGENLGADRCAYAEVDADEDGFRVTGDYTREDVPSIVGRFAMSGFGSEALRSMRANQRYVLYDAETDGRVGAADLAAYRRTGIRAVVCVPLHKGGRFVAGMAVHQQRPRRWTPEEVGLVETVANRCWESLERARAEGALRESEERFRLAFEAAAVGMAHVAPDGRWLEINGKLSEIVGYPPEELLSLTFQDITHPDDLKKDLEHVRRMLVGEIDEYSMEKRYLRKDGRRVWASLRVSLVRDAYGEPGYFVSVIEEITERKHKELVPDPLTARELEVLGLVARRQTNKQIAEDLSYSLGTIKLHVQRIIAKLGVETRAQAATRAVEIGLIPPPR